MKTYPIINIDVQLNADVIKSKTTEELKQFAQEQILPVLITHLSPDTRAMGGEIGCTADTHGNVSCSGSIRW
jgi:hypothetical protein